MTASARILNTPLSNTFSNREPFWWDTCCLDHCFLSVVWHALNELVCRKQQELIAIANRSRVSYINTNRSHNGYLRTVMSVCRCLHPFPGGDIWLRQESLRHVLASPGYAPGKIAVNFTRMNRGFNACQTHAYVPIYLQPFPSNSTRKFKS